MANATFERHTPYVYSPADGHRSEWEQIATQLVRGAMCLDLRDQIAAAAPNDWETGTTLLDSDEPQMQQLGVLYLLGALASTPNNTRALAQQALGELKPYTFVGAA